MIYKLRIKSVNLIQKKSNKYMVKRVVRIKNQKSKIKNQK